MEHEPSLAWIYKAYQSLSRQYGLRLAPCAGRRLTRGGM